MEMTVQGHAYGCRQFPLQHRFDQVAVGSGDAGLLQQRIRGKPGKEDDRNVGGEIHLLRGDDTVHRTGQFDVDQHQIHLSLHHKGHRLLAGTDEPRHLVTEAIEHALQMDGQAPVILHNQHHRLRHRSRSPLPSQKSGCNRPPPPIGVAERLQALEVLAQTGLLHLQSHRPLLPKLQVQHQKRLLIVDADQSGS